MTGITERFVSEVSEYLEPSDVLDYFPFLRGIILYYSIYGKKKFAINHMIEKYFLEWRGLLLLINEVQRIASI